MRLRWRDEQGAALVLVFFVCLAAAVVLQAASGALLCAQRALADESTGRQRLGEKNEILALLRQHALGQWQPLAWQTLGAGEGMLAPVTSENDWLLEARARQDPSLSVGETSAWMERGRDGVDLPWAALVADTLTASIGRAGAWIGVDEACEGGRAQCFVVREPVGLLLGPGCECVDLPAPWALDAGWAGLIRAQAQDDQGMTLVAGRAGADGVIAAERVTFVTGTTGLTKSIPFGCGGVTPEEPAIVALTGGATLDARDRGDFYGVLVVDGGSVLLDGTVVHGAVFASGAVDLGEMGQVLFAPRILRWAGDRSLKRARLMPGTRWEGME